MGVWGRERDRERERERQKHKGPHPHRTKHISSTLSNTSRYEFSLLVVTVYDYDSFSN